LRVAPLGELGLGEVDGAFVEQRLEFLLMVPDVAIKHVELCSQIRDEHRMLALLRSTVMSQVCLDQVVDDPYGVRGIRRFKGNANQGGFFEGLDLDFLAELLLWTLGLRDRRESGD